jgi:hypothetical protein
MYWRLLQTIEQARKNQDLHFAAILSEQTITKCFDKTRRTVRAGTAYRLPVVVWMFLSQVFSADHSCRETVARLNAWRLGRNKTRVSAGTARYCTTRDQLDEKGCHRLVETVGQEIDDASPHQWRWLGHRVRVVDGTTVTMPDTAENQDQYPQPSEQKPGCGHPIMRLVVLFSLTTGVVLRAAMAACQGKQTGESTMLRQHMANALQSGDVLLGDCIFSGWIDVALLQQRGVHVVVHQHQRRRTDFRRGKRLGHGDHLVHWAKPLRPEWMSPKEYDALPKFLVMREVRVEVSQPGFRTRRFIVVTTFCDRDMYPAEALADLYRRRWVAELNLRSLKTHLQMEHLRCKKPHRVRNEVRMHLLAYNLIRGVMATAAVTSGKTPSSVSFKGTMQTLNQFLPNLLAITGVQAWLRNLLELVAAHVVGDRPNRVEPRVIKRRSKNYQLMNRPRRILRKLLQTNQL